MLFSERPPIYASCMTISGGRNKQLDIFYRITDFTSDFLSFIAVELIRFFHGATRCFTDTDNSDRGNLPLGFHQIQKTVLASVMSEQHRPLHRRSRCTRPFWQQETGNCLRPPNTSTLLVYCCLTALSAQTGYIVPQKYNEYQVGLGNNTSIQLNSEITEKTKNIIHTLQPRLFGDDTLDTVRLPWRSLSSQSFGKY